MINDNNEPKLTSSTKIRVEFITNVEIGNNKYIILTENAGDEEIRIITRVHLRGELILSTTDPCPKTTDMMNVAAFEPLVRKHHFEVVDKVSTGRIAVGKKPQDFLEESKVFLRKRSSRKALDVLRTAFETYPDDPFIQSYYGCLLSVTDKKYQQGINLCKKAIENLKIKIPFGKTEHYPNFYLNLCRAYLAANDKKKAVETVYEGIRFDKEEGLLHKELVKLGIRRNPPLPFLKRSNPINKYIGLMLYRDRKESL